MSKHWQRQLFEVGLPGAGLDNGIVTDQLYLSIWLDRLNQSNRLHHFEKLLRLIPFTQREQPQSVISIHAIDTTEPPLLERPLNGPIDIDDVMATLRDYGGEDIAYSVESWWDLWQYDKEWQLAPARIVVSCFGPEYDNGTERETREQENFRIDFGVDTNYLPSELPGSPKLIESNIKSLLRLVHEIDLSLAVAKRRLETETGENFADRLQRALSVADPIQ